jgi:tRNA U34 2-thiouridine synthase MnmA/TrmU
MKAIALVSGGLDSTLATKLIKEQGIEIIALNFKTPFSLCDRKTLNSCGSHSRKLANNLGIEFRVINVTDEFFAILKNPKYGYGSNMNPCIDCRILLFKKSKEVMHKVGASFIITGEVLGQRPMSQHKQALEIIEKESGLESLVLRPLSARLLSPTLPERNGWVDRNKLLRFSGRSRKPQMELAKILNIKEYNQPAGGCLLTDPQFAKRLKDLIMHRELNLDNVELLKIGRHFRISAHAKLIVGRNEKENEQLINLVKDKDYLFVPTEEIAGPTSLGRGIFNDESVKVSCSITCRYCDLNGRTGIDLIYWHGNKKEILKISPLAEDRLKSLRI